MTFQQFSYGLLQALVTIFWEAFFETLACHCCWLQTSHIWASRQLICLARQFSHQRLQYHVVFIWWWLIVTKLMFTTMALNDHWNSQLKRVMLSSSKLLKPLPCVSVRFYSHSEFRWFFLSKLRWRGFAQHIFCFLLYLGPVMEAHLLCPPLMDTVLLFNSMKESLANLMTCQSNKCWIEATHH